MSKYTKAVCIAFNDNDGGLSYSVNPESAYDVDRYYKLHGKWRARLKFFLVFWRGLQRLESIQQQREKSNGY